jgi:hypothetical protein
MRDGLYKVEFKTPLGAGSGVVHVQGGKLWGGDTGMFYVGSFTQSGDQISATVRTGRHTANSTSVFGQDRVEISLTGKASGDVADLIGQAPQAPNVRLSAVLTRISD